MSRIYLKIVWKIKCAFNTFKKTSFCWNWLSKEECEDKKLSIIRFLALGHHKSGNNSVIKKTLKSFSKELFSVELDLLNSIIDDFLNPDEEIKKICE